MKRVRDSNPSLMMAAIERLNLIETAISNFMKVKNARLHPKFYRVDLKVKTFDQQHNEMINKMVTIDFSQTDTPTKDPRRPVSKGKNSMVSRTSTIQVETSGKPRGSVGGPTVMPYISMTKTITSPSQMLKAANLNTSGGTEGSHIDQDSSEALHQRIRTSDIEISEQDLEFLMHNYSSSARRK